MKNVIINIDIKKIYPNPEQPRKTFENIEDLALTIKYNGLINPITVVKSDEDRYMIVSGERRYRACLLNQLKFIKCNIVDIDEFQLQEMTLIENIQRDDLTDFEKAKYIGLMWSTGRYEKKQDLAAALGKSQSYISKAFSCLKLDETILQDLENNSCDVPLSVLDEISKIKDKDNQKDVYSKYLNNEITRDEIRIIKPQNVENFARENLDNKSLEQSFDFEENTPVETKEKEFIVSIYNKEGLIFQEDNFIAISENQALLMSYKKYPEDAADEDFIFKVSSLDVETSIDELNVVEILKAKIKELEKEIEELNKKEVYIVSHRQKKGTESGGGFRCRALHEYEAIELGKKHYPPKYANDKNIIWEARTLKSHCNVSFMSDYIAYGFGTVNDIGTYIAIHTGDFEGTFTFEKGGDFVKTTNDKEYQVIIKEI